jgi:hypothetical protein
MLSKANSVLIDGSPALPVPTWYPEFSQLLPIPNSSMFVLPTSTAPAALRRATTVASRGGM